jgi:hypothetical protein
LSNVDGSPGFPTEASRKGEAKREED